MRAHNPDSPNPDFPDPGSPDRTETNPESADDRATERSPQSAASEAEETSSPARDPAATEEAAAVADPDSGAAPDSSPGDGADSAATGDPAPDVRSDADEEDPDPREDDAPDRIAELEAERDRLRERHLRLAADFDNFRKRTEERVRRRWDSAQADLVGKLLDPLDDLLRVTALEPGSEASVDSIVEGIGLVERKFMQALGEAGVETVDPAGEPFDPNTMEAMMRQPADSEEMDDTVAMVFQRGYTLRGLLIRPARVSVYKCQ